MNNGSTDNIDEVMNRYSGKKVRHICQENRALSASRNVGIKNARGRFLVFLDADDTLLPSILEVQVPFLIAVGFNLLVQQGQKRLH
jgi:glycosyltransferase involved in cell wall biosynthesis